ncbi:hypothetical protein BOTBODRAFT_232238 [Botryobasidium botryosum FD-172 SS1]|uniref:Uncharacterized protein n=1 Tax=Botryobasidium botryosum (strain FD-172 SS1) TaxID=930990 RepID=A0A067LUY9_BOTB1|nr:hypothetical protein BOTBODRAFT_232238 [Botryobasidium botryosum FD-172 SS1]
MCCSARNDAETQPASLHLSVRAARNTVSTWITRFSITPSPSILSSNIPPDIPASLPHKGTFTSQHPPYKPFHRKPPSETRSFFSLRTTATYLKSICCGQGNQTSDPKLTGPLHRPSRTWRGYAHKLKA